MNIHDDRFLASRNYYELPQFLGNRIIFHLANLSLAPMHAAWYQFNYFMNYYDKLFHGQLMLYLNIHIHTAHWGLINLNFLAPPYEVAFLNP